MNFEFPFDVDVDVERSVMAHPLEELREAALREITEAQTSRRWMLCVSGISDAAAASPPGANR